MQTSILYAVSSSLDKLGETETEISTSCWYSWRRNVCYSDTPSTWLQYHLQNVDMIAAVTNEKRRDVRRRKSKITFVMAAKCGLWIAQPLLQLCRCCSCATAAVLSLLQLCHCCSCATAAVVPLRYNLHSIIAQTLLQLCRCCSCATALQLAQYNCTATAAVVPLLQLCHCCSCATALQLAQYNYREGVKLNGHITSDCTWS